MLTKLFSVCLFLSFFHFFRDGFLVGIGTCKSCSRAKYFNPLTPKRDYPLISPHSISSESNSTIMRIMKIINNYRSCGLLSKFFLSAPSEMYREPSGEYAY